MVEEGRCLRELPDDLLDAQLLLHLDLLLRRRRVPQRRAQLRRVARRPEWIRSFIHLEASTDHRVRRDKKVELNGKQE